MSRPLTTFAVATSLIGLVIVALTLLSVSFPRAGGWDLLPDVWKAESAIPFDAALWTSNEANWWARTPRFRIAKGVAENHECIGKPEAAIRDQFGTPDGVGQELGAPAWYYGLEPAGIDFYSLIVRFKGSVVESTELVRR